MFFPSLRRFVFNAIKRCATCEEKKESCTDSLAYITSSHAELISQISKKSK